MIAGVSAKFPNVWQFGNINESRHTWRRFYEHESKQASWFPASG